jgi:hypothetical protein
MVGFGGAIRRKEWLSEHEKRFQQRRDLLLHLLALSA